MKAMAEPLKAMYNADFYRQLASILNIVSNNFDEEAFMSSVFTPAFELMELKERMRHTTLMVHPWLEQDFRKAARQLTAIIDQALKKEEVVYRFAYMFLPDYLEVFGLQHYEASVSAMEKITTFISCEFAVRHFIVHHEDKMMAQMLRWASHEHDHVRRLASEGTRPKLPWAIAVPSLKKHPERNLPILDVLKNDPSEFVRKSVANHLNDFSKDFPDLLVKTAQSWKGHSRETDALVKHACRTLLKQGQPEILALFGLESGKVLLSHFHILTPEVTVGENLTLAFSFSHTDHQPLYVRLEYAIDFLRSNGTYHRKVFKISEKWVEKNTTVQMEKNHSFRPITTRVYYSGQHQVTVLVNGEALASGTFELKY